MKKAIVIQARMSSSRLTGKVLRPFFNNNCILEIISNRLRLVSIPVIVATSTSKCDDEIEFLCKTIGIDCFRGSEHNVLDRFVQCADHFGLTHIFRVCADNPFILPEYVIDLIDYPSDYDYISFCDDTSVPAIIKHWGLFAEGVTTSALKNAISNTNSPEYLEHVTNYIYSNPLLFNVNLIPAPKPIRHRNDLRFTIDNIEDFKNMSLLYLNLVNKNLVMGLDVLISEADATTQIKKTMLRNINLYQK